MIRDVRLSDAKSITEIYNHYINNTIITFEDKPIDASETQRRITKVHKKGYPYIVLEEDGVLIGYAYVDNWRERVAYDITLETSIYLEHSYIGRGAGTALYRELVNRSREIGIHSLIGVISLPNDESLKLHKKTGFKRVGTFEKVGFTGTLFLFGDSVNTLIDVDFWQLIL